MTTRRTFEYAPAPGPEDLLAVYPDFAPEFVDA
jgi:hypothetical protein